MKIIQERKPFETWSIQVDCTGGTWEQHEKVPCGSTLEINAEDIYKRGWFKYPDYDGTSYGFVCPICGCFTDIDENILSKHLKNMAKEYGKNYSLNKLIQIGGINMYNFTEAYNGAVDIANCSLSSLKAKENIRDIILVLCVDFANQYEQDMNFRKEADEYARHIKQFK